MCLGSGVAELPGGIRLTILDTMDIIMIRSQPRLRCVSPVADLQSCEVTSSRIAGAEDFLLFLFKHFFFFNLNHAKTAAG